MKDDPLNTLIVFGATQGVGREAVLQGLEKGHRVIAVARSAQKMGIEHSNFVPHAGDLMDPHVSEDAIRLAQESSDRVSVICTLGAPALSTSKIRTVGTENILRAMKRRGLNRILALSLLGAHETRRQLPPMLRYLLFPLYLRRPVAEHEKQETLLRDSGLNWTILRPPFLTDAPRTGDYAEGFGDDWSRLSLKISRADTAHFFVKHAFETTYDRRAVGISYLEPHAQRAA